MATTRSLLGLDGKQGGLHTTSETVSHVLQRTLRRRVKAVTHTAGNCVVLHDKLYFTSVELSAYVRVCVPEVCVSAWITDSVEKASHLAGWLSARPQ